MIDCYKVNGDGGDQLEEEHHLGSTTPISLRGAKRVEPPVTSSWKALKNDQMPPPSSHRITLQDLRDKLSKVLGPRKEREYCNVFASFLSRRLSKSELDKRLTQTLGRDNICLHNQIVRAILSSSLSSHSPPQRDDISSDTSSRSYLKRKPDGEHEAGGLKRLKVRDEDVVKEEIEAPLGVPFCVQSIGAATREPSSSTSSSTLSWSRLHRLEEEEDDEEDDTLPDTDSLRGRMQPVVEQAGLHGLSDDSALVLSHALDHHLRGLIDACIQLKRTKTVSCRRQGEKISIGDFKSAMELQPQQLGENWPLVLEKLSILVFERLDTDQTCNENQL